MAYCSSSSIKKEMIPQVEWAKEFGLHVSRKYLANCGRPIFVSYSHPQCVGNNDKIRLYSITRADVTSAHPPSYEK